MQYCDTLKISKDTLLDEEHLRKIQEFTQETAFNTAFSFWREGDFWEYMAISLSVLAILLAVITAVAQWKTERNTRISLSMKTQVYESIFRSLLNDLYRIQCDILSLQIVLMENDFKSYPTERYLKNMMIKFDDSNLDSFLVVFNKQHKGKAEEDYLKMQELNNEQIRKYNVNIEMLIEHLKDSSIDSNVKLFDFSIINNSLGYLGHKIIQTAKFIYGKDTDVGSSSILQYVKRALDFYQLNENHITSKGYYDNLKKHEDIITPVLRNFFEKTGIEYTEEMKILAYKLIADEIEESKRSLIRLKS